MKRIAGVFLAIYISVVLTVMIPLCVCVYVVDPYMHYHKPLTDRYYYSLQEDLQRYQNNGILKNFDYDAVIIGTSMTENFKASEMDRLFGTHAVKTPFFGAGYKEINDNLDTAYKHQSELRVIIRSLDLSRVYEDGDYRPYPLSGFKTLYDDNPWNDQSYLFSKEVFFQRIVPMLTAASKEGFSPGITTFDSYSNWMEGAVFGKEAVIGKDPLDASPGEPIHLTREDREKICMNIRNNVLHLAKEHPDTAYYCFFPPYSAYYWYQGYKSGEMYRNIEVRKTIAEELVDCENIRLFSFDEHTEITTDLNHYKDASHYDESVNTMMLQWMAEDEGRLTTENLNSRMEKDLAFYREYNYRDLIGDAK